MKLHLVLKDEERKEFDLGFEYIVNIDPKDLSRFVDDTLAGFDAILHRVIAQNKFGIDYIDTTEEQQVEIDNIIESLK